MSIELSWLQLVEYGCPNDIERLYANYIPGMCVSSFKKQSLG